MEIMYLTHLHSATHLAVYNRAIGKRWPTRIVTLLGTPELS